ncbi:MAG: alkaline phosphatase family protein, partial [Bacteroidia bacterium]|nr:alkaline phosphatase family protein [Bacteroidia bacterium]
MLSVFFKNKNTIGFVYILNTIFLFNTHAQSVPRPKLVVGIVVDQMRQDYLYRYWDKYTNAGFKKMITEGFNCKNTQYNYTPTYTGPGHASVYTGTTPAYHGIAANDWYNRSLRKTIYCAEDSTVNPFVGSVQDSRMSPRNLLTTTITDELKLFTNQQAIVIGTSIKNRGAIMPAGHLANAAFWLDRKNGKWTTSSFYVSQLPKWLVDFNKKELPEKYLQKIWEPLYPIEKYTESLPDNNPYEGLFKGNNTPTFPYKLAELKEKNAPYNLLATTPFGNDLLNDFVFEVLQNYPLGQDDITDFLTVSYSSTDMVGHWFSPTSIEVEDTYLRLDKNIAELINKIETKVGKGQVLFFLTADHAGAYNPQFLIDNKVPAGFANNLAMYDSLKLFALQKFGNAALIDTFMNDQVYLNRELIAKRWYPLNYFQKILANYITHFPGVANVITAEELKENNYTEGFNAYSKRGTHVNRSGDILITYEPGWYEPYGWDKKGKPFSTGTTHGSAYRYDTHVPLLWYGWKIPNGETSRRISITDVAPT